MRIKLITLIGLLAFVLFMLYECTSSPTTNEYIEPVRFQAGEINKLVQLPLGCIDQEWPNKLNQTLDSASEMGVPAALHPVFYGCFDWHSAVHSHWTMVRLWPLLENEKTKQDIINVFVNNFTEENIQLEMDYFQRSSSNGWERPYGWGWLLKLCAETNSMEGEPWENISKNIEPLCLVIRQQFIHFLPNLLYPIRSGEHSNIAFAMSLALDYAEQMNDNEFAEVLKASALRLFANDQDCPIGWEPGGYDFLSPCLEEAYLMAKVMPDDRYHKWLLGFLPELFDPDFTIDVARVADRSDGKLVHLDGLNFSRARCLYGISSKLGGISHLNHLANNHVNTAMVSINDGNYAGEHWLASFAVAAYTDTPR